MEKIQDFLKPNRKNSKTHQGTFTPMYPYKYIGDVNAIYFRSGWELKFYQWCDLEPLVIHYSVESVQVPYINPIDKRQHRYYIDVYMEILMSDGTKVKWLIEIKPDKYTTFPKLPKKKTIKSMRNYKDHYNTVLINIEKFKAAKYYSQQLGCIFGIASLSKKTNRFNLIEWNEDNKLK